MAMRPGLPDFSRLRLAVTGDLIADRDLCGEPTRLSREAPVMVLRHAGESVRAGGAANAARNLRALGASVQVIGGIGRDASGREVLEILERDGIDVAGVETVAAWITPTKTRILAAEPRRTLHQVLRIDREPDGALPDEILARSAERVAALAGKLDALLVSDYEYGGADERLAAAARALAARGATVVLDPRRGLARFRGLSALTPNLEELALAVRREARELESRASIERAAREVLELAGPRWLLVTLGNRGMALFGEGLTERGLWVDASGPEQVVDVSGAGDTAAAVFTLALAAGSDPGGAMHVANAAAGVVVMKQGTATCSRVELERALAPAAPSERAATGEAPRRGRLP